MNPEPKEWKLFRDKSVLVTGASGFVGKALVTRLLDDGARVYQAWRNWGAGILGAEKIFLLDLTNFNDVMHVVTVAEPDYVFHLGAVTQVTEAKHWPIHTFNVNAVGTMNLLEACRILESPEMQIIVASSDKAYGEPTEGELPLKETNRLRPVHPYDLSKSCADLIAQSYAKYFDMQIQITRMSNIYGPGDTNWKRLIPGFVRWAVEGKQGVIRSDGKQIRQYLYIDDAIEAYHDLAFKMASVVSPGLALEIPNGEAWNFAPDTRYPVVEVVKLIYVIAANLRYPAYRAVVLDEAQDETPVMDINNYKAKNTLNWEPKISMREGIKQTLMWAARYLGAEKKARERS